MIENYDQHLIEWLRLIRTQKVGPVSFWHLLRHHGSAHKALQSLLDLPNKSFVASHSQAEQEIEGHHKRGLHLLPAFDDRFPEALKLLPDCPPLLSAYGNIDSLQKKIIGVVGARNASLMGRQFAHRLSADLGQAGWVIVSGLARGIDKQAHQGALPTGTIAVIAGGVDIIYPPEHEQLYQAIAAQGGAIVSEMPLSMHPGATHFPRRNRIISGLSKGIAVIEAAQQSGSLITARYALEQNRDLFAVPGSPYDPRCRGTNELLRNGAYLLETAQDILTVLENDKIRLEEPVYPLSEYKEPPFVDPKDLKKHLLDDLSATPLSIEVLIEQYACKTQDIMPILLEFELAGLVHRSSNGLISRVYA